MRSVTRLPKEHIPNRGTREMSKMRVYELAKKLGVPSKDILNELAKLGVK
ncbi:MAG: hypothetical protein FJ243_02540, partial [Nitrospira sp.]|nr:hypothetical protein [Nitrospira sp.]